MGASFTTNAIFTGAKLLIILHQKLKKGNFCGTMATMTIPKEVKNILTELKNAGFEAYIVGGCVRDFLVGVEPKDWDVTTNAKPEEIQKIFPDSFYENNFLTVGVQTPIGIVEVTTYRLEAEYSDKRHPDTLQYAKTLKED